MTAPADGCDGRGVRTTWQAPSPQVVTFSGPNIEYPWEGALLDYGRGARAGRESSISALGDILGAARVATSFPRVTPQFFKEAGFIVDVVPVSGFAEIALPASPGV